MNEFLNFELKLSKLTFSEVSSFRVDFWPNKSYPIFMRFYRDIVDIHIFNMSPRTNHLDIFREIYNFWNIGQEIR